MEILRRHIKEVAEAAPADARPSIYAIGRALERLFNEVTTHEVEITANLRDLRETIDPLVYDRMRMLAAGISLELAEAYARLADVEIRATIASGERAALRAGLGQAASDREAFRGMVTALTEDLTAVREDVERCCGVITALAKDFAALRAHVEQCCGPLDGQARAVGDAAPVEEECP